MDWKKFINFFMIQTGYCVIKLYSFESSLKTLIGSLPISKLSGLKIKCCLIGGYTLNDDINDIKFDTLFYVVLLFYLL